MIFICSFRFVNQVCTGHGVARNLEVINVCEYFVMVGSVLLRYEQLAHFVNSCAVPCVGWIVILINSCAISACVLCLVLGNSKMFVSFCFLSILVVWHFWGLRNVKHDMPPS